MTDQPTRQLAVLKKFSLANLAEGWDDQAFLLYRPSTVEDIIAMRDADIDSMDDGKALDYIRDFVTKRVVKGRVYVLKADYSLDLQDMEPEDLALLPIDTIKDLFASITGVAFTNPKASAPEAAETQPSSDTATTETSSSTASDPSTAATL